MSDFMWDRRLRELLPLYGHRNWIVVADAAYPAQSKPGIETIVADADQLDAVGKVAGAIQSSKHVRANVYLDSEINFVTEADGPGIQAYLQRLTAMLHGLSSRQLPHEEIIARLDKASEVFRILIIKTTLTVPYTSVFFELDCGYWNADAEMRLRAAIKAAR